MACAGVSWILVRLRDTMITRSTMDYIKQIKVSKINYVSGRSDKIHASNGPWKTAPPSMLGADATGGMLGTGEVTVVLVVDTGAEDTAMEHSEKSILSERLPNPSRGAIPADSRRAGSVSHESS